jgi:hypothetical protein
VGVLSLVELEGGPVGSPGVKALGESFEVGLTGSFSESADELIGLWTRISKLCKSACMKVVAVGDERSQP